MAQWINIHWSNSNTFVVEKMWNHTPSTTGSYGRQTKNGLIFLKFVIPYDTKFWKEKTLAKWLTAKIGR